MKLFIEISFKGLYYFVTDSEYRNFIFLILRFSSFKRYTPFTFNLKNFKWHSADNLSLIWQYKEIFTYNSYKFNAQSEQPVIYDCGSNIGLSCLYYIIHYPKARIVAFEPDPDVFSLLKKNIENINCKNAITLHQKAVWIKNENLSFQKEGADSGSLYIMNKENSIEVEAISLKEALAKESKIDFLKIDIEGAESEVVPDIKEQLFKVKNLFIEYHSFFNKEQNLGLILQIITEAGFKYFLDTQNKRKSAFVNKGKNNSMDLQINIFAYRN